METVPPKEIYSLQTISLLWLFISLLSSEVTVKPATFQKTPDGKEHRSTTVPTFPGTSKTHSPLYTQNQPSKELLTIVEMRGESRVFKEARNSFFDLGVYLLKSKFRIEDKLRIPWYYTTFSTYDQSLFFQGCPSNSCHHSNGNGQPLILNNVEYLEN